MTNKDHLETARLQAVEHAEWLANSNWAVVDTRESSITNGSFFYGPCSEKQAREIADSANERNIYGPCFVAVQLVPAT